MAGILDKPIWSADGLTLSNVLLPVTNLYATYNVITEWYDGTPMDDSKLDTDLVYVKFEDKYLLRNMDYGQVLQKDTMDNMRALSTEEILLLRLGVYKHVQLNGYYVKGDAPSIIYSARSKSVLDEDDAYSIIVLGTAVLYHDFSNEEVCISNTGVQEEVDAGLKIANILKKYNSILIDKNIYINPVSIAGVSNIKIRSVKGVLVKELTLSTAPLITFNGGSNIVINSLTFLGKETSANFTTDNNLKCAIHFVNSNKLNISEINVSYKTSGIIFTNSSDINVNDLNVAGVFVGETPVQGTAYGRNFSNAIRLINSHYTNINNLTVSFIGSAVLGGSDSTYITSSNINSSDTFDNGIYYSSVHNSIIINSKAKRTAGVGFKARGTGNNLSNLYVDTANAGISITDTGNYSGEGNSVYYCNIRNISTRGIEISKDTNQSYHTKIIGNILDTINTSNKAGEAAIISTQTRSIISGNTIKNVSVGYGILKSVQSGDVSDSDIIETNFISNVPEAIRVNNHNNIIIRDNIIRDSPVGISLRFVTKSLICGNIVSENISTSSLLMAAAYVNTGNVVSSDNLFSSISADYDNNIIVNNYDGYNRNTPLVPNNLNRGSFYNLQQGGVDVPKVVIKKVGGTNFKDVSLAMCSSGNNAARETSVSLPFLHFNTETNRLEWFNGASWVGSSPNASPTSSGLVRQMNLITDSTATDIAGVNSKLNTILAELKNKGIMSNI